LNVEFIDEYSSFVVKRGLWRSTASSGIPADVLGIPAVEVMM
jgi:hypothetical protein